MAGFKLILVVFLHFIAILTATPTTTTPDPLLSAESTNPDQLEIVKQIKKLNDDGSYTIGYEADDGSFKIESRDVLGNVKGTYGYVDASGHLKRVSYSTSNATDPTPAPTPALSVVQRIPKLNRTLASPTTRRPTYLTTSRFPHTSAKPTHPPIHLPHASHSAPKPIYAPISLPQALTTPQSRPKEIQIHRPEVLITPRPADLRTAPEPPILRRQLENPQFDARQHVFTLQQSLGADSGDVYSSPVTTRPLFTTTARPRVSHDQPPPDYAPESSTPAAEASTASAAPVLQIPANREMLVAVRHPSGTVLVPLSHYQAQQRHFRPLPVQVDETGYVREMQPRPEPDIEAISPPVSTRDFQRLLQQLIVRQTRLERVSAMTTRPYFVRVPQVEERAQEERYLDVEQAGRRFVDRGQDRELYREAYTPNRRVARLLQPEPRQQNEEYLPADVREMLLLRMLQLAINPALPLREDGLGQGTTAVPVYKRPPVKNVEILGEEEDEAESRVRSRKYRQRAPEMDYY